MDKNRNLPIDQFFVDLRQYEAAEPSGTDSWEEMKRLLDRELPEGRQFTRNTFRKRYLLPLLLLFIGGASYLLADRYHLSLRSGSPEDPVVRSAPSGKIHGDPSKPAADLSLTAPGTQERSVSGENNAFSESAEDRAGRQALAYAEKQLEAADRRPEVLASTRPSENPSGRHQRNGFPGATSGPPREPAAGAAATPGAGTAVAGSTSETSTTGSTPETKPAEVAVAAHNASGSAGSSTPITERNLVERLYPRDKKQATGADHAASGTKTETEDPKSDWLPVNSANGVEIVRHEKNGDYFKVDRDTFKRIEKQVITVEDPADPGRRDFKVDTLSIIRIEKVTYYPITYPAPVFAEKEYAAVASNSDYVLETATKLVPLSSYKVASKKVKPTAFTSLKQTATGLESFFNGEKDWYMAVFAGGHASLGNPGSLGIQAGIAALYTFRERWVLSAEARFMRTYFPGYKLLDASSNFELNKSQVPGGWLFSGTETVTTNAYNLRLLNSLHVPVTLSYNFGRLSAFGGVDLSYSFPLKWEKETSFSSLPVSRLSADGQNPFINETFTLNEQTAFQSRLGLGYVAGLSYDFSRKLSMDFRLRQTLWDNGLYELDNLKKLYRRPSAELTLGFFFGRREKVIYIMDTHR